MDWLQRGRDGSASLLLHIQPGAKRTEIVGLHGDALKIRLAAPPVDGKANAALLKLVAEAAGLAASRAAIVSGATARLKRIRLSGEPAALIDALSSRPEIRDGGRQGGTA